jgi:hypothetical protein
MLHVLTSGFGTFRLFVASHHFGRKRGTADREWLAWATDRERMTQVVRDAFRLVIRCSYDASRLDAAGNMQRRTFIAGLSGTAILPVAAAAQQPSMPVVGFLNTASQQAFSGLAGC